MTANTPRHGLPLLVVGQAQKDVTHNEAVLALDLLLHSEVASRSVGTPPESPEPGTAWIVPEGAVGAWAGQAQRLAAWTHAGWRFLAPAAGQTAWVVAESRRVRWDGAQWTAQSPVDQPPATLQAPAGGSVVDVQARESIVALHSLLRSLGFVT
jgi:hypothetical protein